MNRDKIILSVSIMLLFGSVIACKSENDNKGATQHANLFIPPDTSTIPGDEYGQMVKYGRDLILNTSYYIGPKGTVGKYLGNSMNCTNCHLKAGTQPYALNFFSSHARYPQYRGRENQILTLAERVNNCIEHPHNGRPMPLDSKEMIAIVSYMRWLSSGVPTGQRVEGDVGIKLNLPKIAASPKRGEIIYNKHCASCHGNDGQGVFTSDKITYVYPPLWGQYGYKPGSSMHRVLMAAKFIKANMPKDKARWDKPFLTDQEAIDVAAFINDDDIHKRPDIESTPSYPNIKVKPIDYDAGPYIDTFSVAQHKYGPFQPIIDFHEANKQPVIF